MSPAGDIIDRKAKSVTPSPEVRAAVGIPDDAPQDMTPNELIKAILKAPVDLLWNGGIGTYVKSSKESNSDVEEYRANDSVRIRNGTDIRARVVGEGGNLGATELGRIEYALGGRTHQHRLHRQLRRRRHVRPRGELEDLVGPRRVAERTHVGAAQRAAPIVCARCR